MAFYDAFFGSDQSLYTAYAIIAAIIAICITILLTATDVSVGNRILIVLFVIVTLIPSIFLTLFEITCMVTGGTEPNRWWCYAFAWVLAAFIIIYCIFVVVISLISLFTYNSAIDNLNEDEARNKLTPETSNTVAKEIINIQDNKEKEIEKFYNNTYTKSALDVLSNFQNYEPEHVPTTVSGNGNGNGVVGVGVGVGVGGAGNGNGNGNGNGVVGVGGAGNGNGVGAGFGMPTTTPPPQPPSATVATFENQKMVTPFTSGPTNSNSALHFTNLDGSGPGNLDKYLSFDNLKNGIANLNSLMPTF
jgi:hypothetical protein